MTVTIENLLFIIIFYSNRHKCIDFITGNRRLWRAVIVIADKIFDVVLWVS